MLKAILILSLSIFLFSCGAGDASEESKHADYYLEMDDSKESIDSDHCNYMGSGSKITFGIGDKGELVIFELYEQLANAEMSSFEGKTFPAEVSFNDAPFEGEVLIKKIEEEKNKSKSDFSKNYKVSGVFTGAKGKVINFAVSLFRMQ